VGNSKDYKLWLSGYYEMTEFPIPKRVSADDIKDILKAYYIEGAHNEPVKTAPVEDSSGLSDRVGRQTKFLVELGLLEKNGRERSLTNDGEDVAEALMGGNESLAKSLMREVFTDWEFTGKIRGFLRMNEPEPTDTDRLLEYIDANTSGSDKRGYSTLIELLVWVDLLEETEDGYSLSDGKKDQKDSTVKDDVPNDKKPSKEREDIQRDDVAEMPNIKSDQNIGALVADSGKFSFSIEMTVSPEDNPDEVESIVSAVRRGLKRDVGADEDTDS
jgi:hypothetical protein